MIKVIWNIVKKIFGVVFLLLSPLKRLWCRRKRRTSDPILPIANHYPSVENLNASYTPVNGSAKVWFSATALATSIKQPFNEVKKVCFLSRGDCQTGICKSETADLVN